MLNCYKLDQEVIHGKEAQKSVRKNKMHEGLGMEERAKVMKGGVDEETKMDIYRK